MKHTRKNFRIKTIHHRKMLLQTTTQRKTKKEIQMNKIIQRTKQHIQKQITKPITVTIVTKNEKEIQMK